MTAPAALAKMAAMMSPLGPTVEEWTRMSPARERLHRALAQNEALHKFMMGLGSYLQGDRISADRHLRAAGAALSQRPAPV